MTIEISVSGLSGGAIESWSPIVSWLLVIAGWRFVSRDQSLRENRKDTRAQIDRIDLLLSKIEASAHDYFCRSANDDACVGLAITLKRDIQRLGGQLALVRSGDDEYEKPFIALRQAITGDDFDSPSRRTRLADSIKLHEISQAVNDVTASNERWFRARYEIK